MRTQENNQITSAQQNSTDITSYTVAPWFEQSLKAIQLQKQNKKLNEQVNYITSLQPTLSAPLSSIKPKNKPILDKEYTEQKSKQHKEDKLPVQPFRNKEDIERAKAYFHDTPSRYKGLNMRNYAMFVLGINTARRAGDIAQLQVKDVLDENGEFRKHLIIEHEEKTKKRAVILLHPNVKEALTEYLNTLDEYKMSDYLFANYKTHEPLKTNAIWKMMNKMQQALDLDINLGSHSMRKTFAYQAAKNNPNDSATEIKTSKFLNHANVETTHGYMQAGQDEMDEYVLKNGL